MVVRQPEYVATPRRTMTERADVAEKYVNQRTQSFTRTHARRMEQFLSGTGGSEDDYWEQWSDDLARSIERWTRDVAAIDSDANMTFVQKREAKNRLVRLWPSWGIEQEERFIAQYGDPRLVARGRLETLVSELQGPTWRNALREGALVEVPKAAWEQHFYDALVNPQDGSVPLALDAVDLTPPGASRPPAPIGDIVLPGEAVEEVDPKMLRARVEAARRICPYCYEVMGRKPGPQHLKACATAHGKVYEG